MSLAEIAKLDFTLQHQREEERIRGCYIIIPGFHRKMAEDKLPVILSARPRRKLIEGLFSIDPRVSQKGGVI